MPDISVALGLLKKPIEIVISLAAGELKSKLQQLKAESKIRSLYQKLNATQKIKTIWDVDRSRSISSFYYPAKIKTSTGAKQLLSSLDELPANAVVLSGTVGQGKSILLRNLLGKEMRTGKRIPLFIELRRVPLIGLEAYLKQVFADIFEISGSSEIFEVFAKNGIVSFLLDGFDEIEPSRAQDLMTSIEALVTKYPTARTIVTSRPSAGIEVSALFDVVHIAPLSDGDFSGFFNKIIPRDRVLAERITNAVMISPSVKSVASTPLLATLLTIVYRSTQRIPADFSEFYDELFQILLVRHDRSKAYSRKRKTELGDREIQQAFEAFCFKAHADGKSVLTKQRALEISKDAISTRELVCLEDNFLSDVVRVTCLLQEEGNSIEFVHQSVREFYAAKYIASRPDEIVRKFYTTVAADGKWRKWDQVLNFLSQLDQYRINRMYLIPMAHQFLRSVSSDGVMAAPPRLREVISDLGGVKKNEAKKPGDKQSKFVGYRKYPDSNFHWDILATQIFQFFYGNGGIAGSAWVGAFDGTTPDQSKTFTEIATHCGKINELDKFLTDFVSSAKNDLKSLENSAHIVDSSVDFMGM